MAVHRSQILCLVLDENNYITNDVGDFKFTVVRGRKFGGRGARLWRGLSAMDVREGAEGNEGGGAVAGHRQADVG